MSDDISRMVRDTARRLLAAECGRPVLRDGERGLWPARLWGAFREAGLPLAAVAESAGGVGLPIEEALELVRAAGEHAAPVPLGETIVAAWLLDRAGLAVPDGPLAFAPSWSTALATRRDGDATRIDGAVERVPWGRELAGLVVLTPAEAGRHDLVLLGPADWTVLRGDNLAGEPRDTLKVATVLDPDRVALSPMAPQDLDALGAALRVLQIAGALARITERTVAYSKDRVQFGRPLAGFQAIQQSLAVLASQAAVAGAAGDMAKAAVSSGALLPGVAVAKARAGEAAGLGASIAHQVHGAIGFTLEHELQFSTKRLWAWRDEFGNEDHWNRLFGRHLLQAGPDRIWAEIALD